MGYLYLFVNIVIFFTSWLNFFILKYVFKYYTNLSHVYAISDDYYTVFAQLSSLQYAMTHIPIWIMAQKGSLRNLHSSKLLKFFIAFCFFTLVIGVTIPILTPSSAFLLIIYGFFILPYLLIPVLIFLLKVRKRNISALDAFKFHVYTLTCSGVALVVTFLTGGGALRYLKISFNVKILIICFSLSIAFVEFFKRKIIPRLAEKYFL